MTPLSSNRLFGPVVVGSKLRHHALRGAAAAVAAQGLSLAAQVIATTVLARLLTPEDFGVVTMVTTPILLLISVGLNGFTEAVIQCDELDRQTASNLFWLNLGTGLVLALAFASSGSLLERLYRTSLVANVAAGMSLAIGLSAASVMHLALLKRAMHFTAASANDVIGRAVFTAVAVVLASVGWGYWALVVGIVAQQLSITIGAWWLCRWIPSLPRGTGKTGAMVWFAASVYGRFSIRYATENVDNLLVGWHFNATALGFYKKAYDLFALSASQLTGPLHNVALATLSRLNQDPPRFRRCLANSLGIIAFVGMAAGADLTLVGKDLVRCVLGPQWSESGRVFERFGPGIGVMLLSSTLGWIHLSTGKPGRWFRWTVVELTVTVSLFVVALPWGASGVAAAWSVSYWALLLPGFWYAGRPIQFGAGALLGAVWRYAAAALSAGLATAGIIRITPHWRTASEAADALVATVTVSALFITFYLAAVILLHGGAAPLLELAALLRELLPKRRAGEALREPVGECK